MKSIVGFGCRIVLTVSLATLFGACAANKSAPVASPESAATGAASQQPGAYPAAQPSTPYAAPPPPPPPAPSQPQSGAQPGSSSPQQRAMIQGAANEVESSQRELDVAAGDCRNACRALASMDRAAGRLCGLTQGDPEPRRCDDAKQRVYSARDRVKATCGQCEGGPSVERSAPIPSLR